jgi:hypothetical protein
MRIQRQDTETAILDHAQKPNSLDTDTPPTKTKPKRRRRRRKRDKGAKLLAAPVDTTRIQVQAHDRVTAKPEKPVKPIKQIKPAVLAADKTSPLDASSLKPTRMGFIRMRGKSDNGRRWYQEVDPELAITLVRERAAVVVNRNTIRRLFANKEFRRFILDRDNYTCHFCKQYGDTIDHLLPRAKGGHTTPDNCVCACNECNQSKADRDLDEFMGVPVDSDYRSLT